MTDVQINKGIAEACGWKDVWKCEIASEDAPFVGTSPDGKLIPVTDYVNDLNAMYYAEMQLPFESLVAMEEKLLSLYPSTLIFHSTARQRAEAFLKAIGKWKE